MTLPKVADSLAGRIEMHSLWPLSQDELLGKPSGFLQTLFSKGGRFPNGKTVWKDVIRRIVTGGYPEAVARNSESRRTKWFESYMRAVMQKDIRELANIEGLTQIPNILQLIGARVGSTINMSDISRLSGVKNTTLLKPRDFRGLKRLAELAGDKFQKGIVLYNGETSLGFGKNLYGVPISALWEG